MWDTILVPVDLTQSSEKIVKKAVSFARTNRATLILCHVSEIAYVEGSYENFLYTGVDHKNHSIDQLRMEELKKYVIDLGHNDVQTMLLSSTSVSGCIIYEVCADYKIDLIVVGGSLQSKLKSFVLGTTASHITKNATCDVFVVKN